MGCVWCVLGLAVIAVLCAGVFDLLCVCVCVVGVLGFVCVACLVAWLYMFVTCLEWI